MSDIAIQVENLSKKYRIGKAQERVTSSRGFLQKVGAPFRYLATSLRPPEEDEILWVLKDVSFEVKQGEVLGIIGRNGAGKSTLLKILSRITEPTSGRAVINGRVGSLLEVGTGFHPELTGRENIYLNGAILGMRKAEIDKKFDEIVAFAEIEKFLDTPVKRYSSGMYVRLAFAVAAHLEPEILLMDEVLAVGDAAFQRKCMGKMGDVAIQGRTVLFVSHNMVAVNNLCHAVTILDTGKLSHPMEANKAIRLYLQSIDQIKIYNLSERPDRKGNQKLKFTKASICDENGEQILRVLSGQNIMIRIYYESSFVANNAEVLVAFNISDKGFILANLNSHDTGNTNLAIHEKGFFECNWERVNLTSGSYDCTVFCSINGNIVDWVENAFSIDIENGDFYKTGQLIERKGSVLIPNSWKSVEA